MTRVIVRTRRKHYLGDAGSRDIKDRFEQSAFSSRLNARGAARTPRISVVALRYEN